MFYSIFYRLLIIAIFPLTCSSIAIAHGTEKHAKNVDIEKVLDQQKKTTNNNREIEVVFKSKTTQGLEVDFAPIISKVTIKLGEKKKISYKFKNNAGRDIKILATHSVDPITESGKFKKLVCFCFENQVLKKDADIELPILFSVEPSLDKSIKKITILYTLYEVKKPLKDSTYTKKKKSANKI